MKFLILSFVLFFCMISIYAQQSQEYCLFCKIANGKIPACKIYEDEKIVAVLDPFPIYVGHTLVILKQHYVNILEVPDEDLAEILPIVKKISRILAGEGFNLRMGSGRGTEVAIPHLFFEIIPRNWSNNCKLNGSVKRLELTPQELEETCREIKARQNNQ